MSEIKAIQEKLSQFREERDWKQFHNPKDEAISLTLEASELLEHFQWKSPEEIAACLKTNKEEIADEMADVLYWLLLMSLDLEVDIVEAFNRKMEKNAKKYPVEKAKGSHKKYTELQ